MKASERIFRPILESDSGTIYTHDICETYSLETIYAHMIRTGPWNIIIGYLREGGAPLSRLLSRCKSWNFPGHIATHVVENLHLKVWILTDGIWLGTCNLKQCFLSNAMVRLDGMDLTALKLGLQRIQPTPVTPEFTIDQFAKIKQPAGYQINEHTMVAELGATKSSHIGE